MSQAAWQEYRWQLFALTMPAAWEMLQFSRRREEGRCAWADRYGFRLELHWRAVVGEPDWQRMLADYAARLAGQGEKIVEPSRALASWRGVISRQGDLWLHRFGIYVEGRKCLAEMVFLGMAPDDTTVARVLKSFRVESPRDGFERWTAFGLDARVAAGRPLTACRVEPARAQLRFASGEEAEVYERFGLADHWLKEPLATWHRGRAPAACENLAESDFTKRQHRFYVARGQTRRSGVLSRWRSRLNYEATSWRCPLDGRIYRQEIVSAGNSPASGLRLTCCAAMAESG